MDNNDRIKIVESKEFNPDEVIELYKLNEWSSANKPELLIKALKNSATLILAYSYSKLVGIGNALTDGYLVVYYPHLLVHPDYQGQGIGRMIMEKFQEKYGGFHQQILVADGQAVEFYERCGFMRAGNTESMWIYSGDDH